MTQKRKAQQAFGKQNGQLSAFAAARLKQTKAAPSAAALSEPVDEPTTSFATSVAEVPYDGHHSDGIQSGAVSGDDTPAVTPTKVTPSIRLSSFHPTSRNVPKDNNEYMELHLSAGETAVFAGEYDLEVLRGTVTIYGGTFPAAPARHRIFAPSVQALPLITARKNPTSFRIWSVKSSLRKLERLSPLFRNIWATDKKQRSFAFLEATVDDPLQRSLSALETDPMAQKVLTQIAGKAEDRQGLVRAMAVGPKSAGKSTFNRQICNTLLSKMPTRPCYYLDLDPGQPEFGPAGQISLVEVRVPVLGPSFTHQASRKSRQYRLLASHALAATSFKDDPDYYVACVRELMAILQSRSKGKPAQPLVVNSCGWVTGLGAAVLADLQAIIRITDAIFIDGTPEPLMQTAQANSESCFTIPRAPSRPSTRSPAELRAMQIMAYFHSRSTSDGPSKWTGKPLSALRPWIASYSGPLPGVSAILSYGQSVPADYLGEVLDGSLVAIVAVADDASLHHALSTSLGLDDAGPQDAAPTDLIARTPSDLPYIPTPPSGYLRPLDPRHSTFLSLALVRGIDPDSQSLQLLTPLPASAIAGLADQKILLVRGGFDAPEWAYLEDLYGADKGAEEASTSRERPWVTKKEPQGIEGAVWRLRHPPTASQIAGGGR